MAEALPSPWKLKDIKGVSIKGIAFLYNKSNNVTPKKVLFLWISP